VGLAREHPGWAIIPERVASGRDLSTAWFDALGIRTVRPLRRDPLFRIVRLPAAWTLQPAEGGALPLVDARGETRAVIVYESTPFARDAFIAPPA
jgi:hypothetical protein